jgi:hypothetical protein
MNIEKRVKEDYKTLISMGYEPVGVFLVGSQNYELDYEGSDIDTKAIVLPSFKDFILRNKEVSFTHVLPSNEHIDVKDIRLMFGNFKKQNINFLEILFTKYSLMNEKYASLYRPMFDNREAIASYDNYASMNTMAGMAYEKRKALCHPYPSIVDKIEKFGYDPKQLHHIIRLREFIERRVNGETYEACLVSPNKKYLVDVKRGIHTLEEAIAIADKMIAEIDAIKKEYGETHPHLTNDSISDMMNEVMVKIFKLRFKED